MIDVKTADRELQLYVRPQTFPVAIRMLRPAWPPGPERSSTTVFSPSEAAYTAAARPAGPAPMTTRS